MTAPQLVEVTRRDERTGQDLIESVHHGHLAVARADGHVLASAGDAQHPTFVRSAAKPFQAMACLELLGPAADELTAAEVAVSWSSHRAEERHLDAVRRLLERSGTAEDALTCPVAIGEARPGASPSRVQRDCSGKHALFALAGHQLGLAGPALVAPDGVLQRAVLDLIDSTIGPIQALGIDGCGAPAVQVPLAGLAQGFADLAAGGRGQRVRDAGFAHPELVGGEGRAETALLAAGIVAKPGAEGVFAAGWRDAAGQGSGVAVKVLDGAARGAATAVVGVLEALGVLEPGTWTAPAPTGGNAPVGEVRAAAAVRDLDRQLS